MFIFDRLIKLTNTNAITNTNTSRNMAAILIRNMSDSLFNFQFTRHLLSHYSIVSTFQPSTNLQPFAKFYLLFYYLLILSNFNFPSLKIILSIFILYILKPFSHFPSSSLFLPVPTFHTNTTSFWIIIPFHLASINLK